MTTKRTTAVTVRLNKTLIAQLNDRAQLEETSGAEVMRKALEHYFAASEQAALLDDLRGNLLARLEACQGVVDKKHKISAEFVVKQITGNKVDKPADDKTFREALRDNLWRYNDGMARYVLCRLDESFATREYAPNLWKRDERGKFIWTVEHVLPQTDNLRKEWIEMIAGGDKDKAREIQEAWVDCLGNLTLSGYNSKLSDKPFPLKQASNEMTIAGDRLNIGYKNGLALNSLPFKVPNESGKTEEALLSTTKGWTAREIEARNEAITDRLMKLFKL